MGFMFEKMGENMKGNGKIIKCQVKVYLFEVMVEYIKENTWRIKNKDLENLFGKMGENI